MRASVKNILYVIKGTKIGGSNISLYELIINLDKSRYSPVILFYDDHPYQEKFRDLGLKVLRLRHIEVNEKSDISVDKNNFGYSDEIIQQARAFKKDVIIKKIPLLFMKIYRSMKELLFFCVRDVPISLKIIKVIKNENIELLHNNSDLRGDRASVLAAFILGLPQVCHVRAFRAFDGLALVDRLLAKHVSKFIYISKSVEGWYVSLGIPKRMGEVVYNPIGVLDKQADAKLARLRDEFKLSTDIRVVCNVGRIVKWKGYDYFVKAMKKVIEQYPKTIGMIVGEPDTSIIEKNTYTELLLLVEKLGMKEKIIFTGFREDALMIMKMSDIVVHSASEPEPFGRVVAEGMVIGKPVIATNAGGVIDIVKHNETGLLVPMKDERSMADEIVRLLGDTELSEKISKNAQDFILKLCSPESHAKNVQCIYNSVMR